MRQKPGGGWSKVLNAEYRVQTRIPTNVPSEIVLNVQSSHALAITASNTLILIDGVIIQQVMIGSTWAPPLLHRAYLTWRH